MSFRRNLNEDVELGRGLCAITDPVIAARRAARSRHDPGSPITAIAGCEEVNPIN